jgi:hypothetical protein
VYNYGLYHNAEADVSLVGLPRQIALLGSSLGHRISILRFVARGAQSYFHVIEEPFAVKNYSTTFQLGPDRDDDDENEVVWTARFDANGKSDTDAAGVMQGAIDAGLKQIKHQFKNAARKWR